MAGNLTSSLVIESRATLTATAVTEVMDFDDTRVIMLTRSGQLNITGENLTAEFDTIGGYCVIKGKINSAVYGENTEREPRNFLTKLFK